MVELQRSEKLNIYNSTKIPSTYSYIQPESFNGFSFTTNITGIDQIDMVGNNDSMHEVWNRTSQLRSNFVNIDNSSFLSIRTQNTEHYSRKWNNNINQSSERQIFNFSTSDKSQSIFSLNISNLKLNEKSWNYFGIIFTRGNYSFEISFDANVASSEYFYNLQALNHYFQPYQFDQCQ